MQDLCPRCAYRRRRDEAECPRCGVVFRKLEALTEAPCVTTLEPEARRALIAGLVLALVFLFVPFLGFVLGYLGILVHELGHAATGWLFGYPSIPAFDFVYGGGVTSHESRKMLIVVIVLAALAYGLWRLRGRPRGLIAAGVCAALYVLFAFTWLHDALITFMGHGAELIFAGIFLYRAISGSAIRVAAERPLYAFVGFFLVLHDLRFSWRLIHDAAERWAYQEAKGGGHWMDFSVLAEQHFHVGLTTVAGLFWVCCLLPPLLAWATHRYGSHLAVVAHRLTAAPQARRSDVVA